MSEGFPELKNRCGACTGVNGWECNETYAAIPRHFEEIEGQPDQDKVREGLKRDFVANLKGHAGCQLTAEQIIENIDSAILGTS